MSDDPSRYHCGIEEPILPVIAVTAVPAIIAFALSLGAACQFGWLS